MDVHSHTHCLRAERPCLEHLDFTRIQNYLMFVFKVNSCYCAKPGSIVVECNEQMANIMRTHVYHQPSAAIILTEQGDA